MNMEMETKLLNKAVLLGTPVKATLELTPLCNMDCKMCYIRHSKKEVELKGGLKDVEYWKSLMPELKEMGILFITFIGGEPLIYKGFKEIYQYYYENGFFVNITTNGTLITEEVMSWMKDMPPRYITLSLYGMSNETYEKVTGNKNGFTLAMNGLNLILKNNIPIQLNYQIIEDNYKDLDALYQFTDENNLPLLSSSYSLPSKRKPDISKFSRFDPIQCADVKMKCEQLTRKENYAMYCDKIANFSLKRNEGYRSGKVYCHGGTSSFFITWDGKMIPCGSTEKTNVPVEIGKLKSNFETLRQKVLEITTSKKCMECNMRDYCQVCPVVAECETGEYDGTPEYICKMSERMHEIALQYQNEN